MNKSKNTKLPEMFRPLTWSYKFNEMDAERDKHVIIVNAINYGDLEHWRWVVDYYGKTELKSIIASIPFSEFRPGAIKLIGLLLNLNVLNYASRSDYIRGRPSVVRLNQI